MYKNNILQNLFTVALVMSIKCLSHRFVLKTNGYTCNKCQNIVTTAVMKRNY